MKQWGIYLVAVAFGASSSALLITRLWISISWIPWWRWWPWRGWWSWSWSVWGWLQTLLGKRLHRQPWCLASCHSLIRLVFGWAKKYVFFSVIFATNWLFCPTCHIWSWSHCLHETHCVISANPNSYQPGGQWSGYCPNTGTGPMCKGETMIFDKYLLVFQPAL